MKVKIIFWITLFLIGCSRNKPKMAHFNFNKDHSVYQIIYADGTKGCSFARIYMQISEDGHSITFSGFDIPGRSMIDLSSGKITPLKEEEYK